jgi:hypothetical protein
MKRRFFPLALALGAVVLFSACSASVANDPGSGQPTIALHTPAANLTPTPTAPPETIGAFVSNPSPNVNDNISIYVIFHIAANGGTPRGVSGASVSLFFHYAQSGGAVSSLNSQVGAQQTTPDGWAGFSITFTGLTPQSPIDIDVTVSYQNQTYAKQVATFFTPLIPTPTASPSPSPTPAKGPGG